MIATEPTLSGIAPFVPGEADVSVVDFVQTRGWLHADRFAEGTSGAATFSDEEALWTAALSGRGFYETRELTLEDVVLVDWVPRSPGRYHTREAQAAREEAQHRIEERKGDHVVYSASGKTSMVQGGVGCLRLAAKDIGGRQVKFVGATSSGVAHRSFVVALTLADYGLIAGTIDELGGARYTVAGTVRYWNADENLKLFRVAGLPRIYLDVGELRNGTRRPDDFPRIDVTPAVTFEAEGAEYFAYSHFDPADPGHVERAVEWMRRYVSDRYHGRVLTDFDELVTRFDHTAAPVKTLMDPNVPVEKILAAFSGYASSSTLTVIVNNFLKEVVMNTGDNVVQQVATSAGTISGPNVVQVESPGATISVVGDIGVGDLEALAQELAQLRLALKERGTGADQDIAVGEVAQAEEAAKQGDTEGVVCHLKKAGQWALDVATEIGVTVATAALNKALLGA